MFGLAPKKGDDGKLAWTFPMGTAKMAGIAAEDIGKVAYGIFKAGNAVHRQDGRHHGRGADDRADGQTLSKVLGVGPVKYNAVEADVYRSFGFPGADEMGNMFQAYRDFDKEMLGESQRRYGAQAEPCAAELRAVRRRSSRRRSKRRWASDARALARVAGAASIRSSAASSQGLAAFFSAVRRPERAPCGSRPSRRSSSSRRPGRRAKSSADRSRASRCSG